MNAIEELRELNIKANLESDYHTKQLIATTINAIRELDKRQKDILERLEKVEEKV